VKDTSKTIIAIGFVENLVEFTPLSIAFAAPMPLSIGENLYRSSRMPGTEISLIYV